MKISPPPLKKNKQTLGFSTFTFFNFTFCLYISRQEKTAEILIKKTHTQKRALHFIGCGRWSTNGIFYTTRRVLSSSLVFSRNRSKTPHPRRGQQHQEEGATVDAVIAATHDDDDDDDHHHQHHTIFVFRLFICSLRLFICYFNCLYHFVSEDPEKEEEWGMEIMCVCVCWGGRHQVAVGG